MEVLRQQGGEVTKWHVQVDEQGGCQPGLLAARQFLKWEAPPLPVPLACLSSFPPNLSPAINQAKGEEGEEAKDNPAKLVCGAQLESMAACASVSTWLSIYFLLPGYVWDDETASRSQTLVFLKPLSWGWWQNPERAAL